MKHCNTCDKTKPKIDFGKRKASIDGLSPRCRSCLKDYDKGRLRDPKRMKARRDYQKTSKGKAAHNKAAKKWVDKNEIKRAAHIMVGNALRGGRLTKENCEVCGDSESQGHHDDYAFPLTVRWLCHIHHNEWHACNGEGLNAS